MTGTENGTNNMVMPVQPMYGAGYGGNGDMQLGMANGFNGVNNAVFGAQTAISQQMTTNKKRRARDIYTGSSSFARK